MKCPNLYVVGAVGIVYTINVLSAAIQKHHMMLHGFLSYYYATFIWSFVFNDVRNYRVFLSVIPFQHCHAWISGNKPNLWVLLLKQIVSLEKLQYPLALMYIWMLVWKCCVLQSSSSSSRNVHHPFLVDNQKHPFITHSRRSNLAQESMWISSTLGKSTVCEEKLNNSRDPWDSEIRPKSPYRCKKNAKW